MIDIVIQWTTIHTGATFRQEARIGHLLINIWFPDADDAAFIAHFDWKDEREKRTRTLAEAQQWATERIHEAITAAVTK